MAARRKPPMILSAPVNINQQLSEPVILAMANWVRDTTLLYGGSVSTAFTVAGIMAQGLEAELRRRVAASADQATASGEGESKEV